jgi:translation elongation factor EF-G
MSYLEQLETIDRFYQEHEDDKKAEVVAALKKIHVALLKSPDDLKVFYDKTQVICGGIYIPYLFWMELIKFLDHPVNSQLMFDLIQAFANSNFEEEEQNNMKPLLAVYFKIERPFNVDKIKAYIVDKSHPQVRYYLRSILQLVEADAKAVDVYKEKVLMLKRYFPNFETLKLPLSQLKEELQQP